MQKRISNAKQDLAKLKEKLRQATRAKDRADRELNDVLTRRNRFDEGEPYARHRFSSDEEAQTTENKAAIDLELARQEEKNVFEQVQEIEMLIKIGADGWRSKVLSEWVKAAAEDSEDALIEQKRWEAMYCGLRRPWDGDNGDDFERWLLAHEGKDPPAEMAQALRDSGIDIPENQEQKDILEEEIKQS